MNASPVGNSLNPAGLQIKDETGSKQPTLSDSIFFATFRGLNFSSLGLSATNPDAI